MRCPDTGSMLPSGPMTLLDQMERERQESRERLREETVRQLREAVRGPCQARRYAYLDR
jgi:hypothetical protein